MKIFKKMKISSKTKNFFQWFLVLGVLFTFVFFLFNKMPKNVTNIDKIQVNSNKNTKNIKIAGKILKVQLALTPKEQEKGLSGRKNLKEDEGMLFIFEKMDKYSFWMKDMNFSIDIIWIGSDLRVIYIEKNASPQSYPNIFTPKQDAKYVLEVVSSFSEKNNLKEGDKVEFLAP